MTFGRNLRSREFIFNLPNLLTLFRIVLIPVMAVLLAYDGDQPILKMDVTFRYSPGRLASLIVLIAGITDLLDGYLARKWNIESLLGKFLDPLADKLFLMVGLIMLMDLERIQAWLVILLLSRELMITGLRAVAVGEGIVISAGEAGKWKTTFQLIGLGFVMWYGSVLGFSAYIIGMFILYLALGISLFSGYNYLRDFFQGLAQKRHQGD